MKWGRQKYIEYFTKIQEANKIAPLSPVEWNWVIARSYEATVTYKLVTQSELEDMFPDLFKEDYSVFKG
jgi:hypothetical protein